MPNPDEVLQIVRQWVKPAEEDLRSAEHLLVWEESCPTSTVCFHAQQCVEKYLKAFLTSAQIEFPKMHSIVVNLVRGCLTVFVSETKGMIGVKRV